MEANNQHIFIHKLEIRSLKDQVVKLLEEKHYYANNMDDMDGGAPPVQQMSAGQMSDSLQNVNNTRSSANLDHLNQKISHLTQSNQQLEGQIQAMTQHGELQSNISDGAGTNTFIMQPGQVNPMDPAHQMDDS